jgi:hypothetical protein
VSTASGSCLYEGWVRHRRYGAIEHALRTKLYMVYLDLDELPELLDGFRLASARRRALAEFRRADHLGDPLRPLAATIRELVGAHAGRAPQGPVRLLTNLRTFGHCFNPVSFYYCFTPDEQLEAVVAEVTSTPWGERHAYVLGRRDESPVLGGEFTKALHVSPFMAMDQRYRWRIAAPGPTLSVHIESNEHGERAFDATLSLRRAPMTRRGLASMTARYPAATLRVLALIYGHAAALKLKGVPLHPRPEVPA